MKRTTPGRARTALPRGATQVLGTLLVASVAVGNPVSAATGRGFDAVPGNTLSGVAAGDHHVGTRRIAVLIGDSQSAGAARVSGNRTWTQSALRAAGYDVRFSGAGGTGYVASNSAGALNYPSALKQHQWTLPESAPALIVLEGGGNDARIGASDARILLGARETVGTLKARYPTSHLLMVGPLAGSTAPGSARRVAVDALLGTFAREQGITFVSAGHWLTKYHLTGLMADQVHLTQAGHDVLAVAFAEQVRALDLDAAEAGGMR